MEASLIKKPIFIIGTGRSGTTLLLELLAYHPDLAWFSNLTNRYPSKPQLALLHRLLDLSLLGHLPPVNRWLPKPIEAYSIWNYCYKGFARPFRDLTGADVTGLAHRRITQVVFNHQRYQNKSRFIAKYTGWPRVEFINAIFPDALFIHVVRDGRAVVASLLDRDFWRGWEGTENWRWGRLPLEFESEWAMSGYSFIVLAAIQWKILMGCLLEASNIVGPNHFLEIHYEDIVKTPEATMDAILEFCELENGESFRRYIRSVKIYDGNRMWRENLTCYQRNQLEASLGIMLRQLSYPTGEWSLSVGSREAA